ncbi:MAG: hypothetical protein PHI29_04625 [Gallionella sp.]|nr:hypothetical protein [Gallionella sp.]
MNADTPKVATTKTETAKPATSATKPVAKATSVKKALVAKSAAKPAVAKKPVKAAVTKVAAPKTAAKKAAPVKKAKKEVKKEIKVKVVRDSFTMPQGEYQQIADIKAASLKAGMHVKKSEVLRAGLKVLSALTAAELKILLDSLDKIPTGRPKKH